MSSTSSRLGMELPETSDSMAKGDSVLASNYRLIDKNMHVRYESDLANITSPYQGQFALDTDLDQVMFYNSGWKHFGSNGVNQGRLDNGNEGFDTEATDATPGGTPVLVHQTSTAVALVAGRRYNVFISGNVAPGAAANHNPLITIKVSTSSPVLSSDTTLYTGTLYNHSGTLGATKAVTFTRSHFFTTASPVNIGAGSYYFGVFVDCNNASASATYRTTNSVARHDSTIIIRDVGV